MKFLTAALCGAAIAAAQPALANSFINGGFETVTAPSGQLGYNVDATGWTTTGYNFLFASGTGDTTGASGVYGALSLWGSNNGGLSVLPASSPSGGNFVAADGAFGTAPIEQVITGLTIGKTYSVGFDYGYAQQAGFDGDTIQHWSVSFAGQTQTLENYSLANHTFSGWAHASFDFIANNATETLSFLAYGNLPVPPFALLDGVTFTPDVVPGVPEPATWAMLLVGFGGVGALARRRRSGVVAA